MHQINTPLTPFKFYFPQQVAKAWLLFVGRHIEERLEHVHEFKNLARGGGNYAETTQFIDFENLGY
jgi:hypothetical protein